MSAFADGSCRFRPKCLADRLRAMTFSPSPGAGCRGGGPGGGGHCARGQVGADEVAEIVEESAVRRSHGCRISVMAAARLSGGPTRLMMGRDTLPPPARA